MTITLKDGDRIAIHAYQDDDNAWLLYGTFSSEGAAPVIELDRGGEIPMTDEWLERVEPVNDTVARVIGTADYWLTLTVGSAEGESGLLPTGITLPRGD
ncbi:hypothetical protein BH24DEI2_BH24DEI2_13070 [soil metagenome]